MTRMAFLNGLKEVPLGKEELSQYQKDFLGLVKGVIRLSPGDWAFPSGYSKVADSIYKFKFLPDDVIVMTWPKCGTTWTLEIVWTMRNNPDLNHPRANDPIQKRCPQIDLDKFEIPLTALGSKALEEFYQACPNGDPNKEMFLQLTAACPSPRTIKTHLPFPLYPPNLLDKVKVIYMIRDPRDVVLSYFHFARLFRGINFCQPFDRFLEYFLNGDLLCGPYMRHVEEALKRKDHPNLLIVYYEDMKANILKDTKRIADFIGTTLTVDQLHNVINYCSFSQMKERDSVVVQNDSQSPVVFQEVVQETGGFFRKGKAGTWKEELNEAQQELMNKWIEEKFPELEGRYRT